MKIASSHDEPLSEAAVGRADGCASDVAPAVQLTIEVGHDGGDHLVWQLALQSETEPVILSSRIQGSGCTRFLKSIQEQRLALKPGVNLTRIAQPSGSSHVAMLWREAMARALKNWQPPFVEEELCHCRKVATTTVDRAIVYGCHDTRAIARETSAGTSCGTCQNDTLALIRYRQNLV